MHIKVKENQIIIEFSEKESAFIKKKTGEADFDNVSDYIKEKLVKAFSLDDLDVEMASNFGKDFSLHKIKNVTAELKKRNQKDAQEIADTSAADKNENIEGLLEDKQQPSPADSVTNKNVSKEISEGHPSETSLNDDDKSHINEIRKEIGDELLADLLDEGLLKGHQKPKNESES